jgi:hypothetical protein
MRRWMSGSRLLGCLLVAAFLTSACTPGRASSPTPSPCDGISAEIGGCDPDRPTFSGTTCAEVGAEWGETVDRRILAVIDGPRDVGGKAKSVRISDAMVLAFVLSTLHLDTLGQLSGCTADEYFAAAEPEFTPDLKARIVDALYDGDPVATYDQFIFEVKRVLKPLG